MFKKIKTVNLSKKFFYFYKKNKAKSTKHARLFPV